MRQRSGNFNDVFNEIEQYKNDKNIHGIKIVSVSELSERKI